MDISSIEKNVPGRGYIWTEQGNKRIFRTQGEITKREITDEDSFCMHT